MDLGEMITYLTFDTYVIIKCKGDVVAEGVAADLADNMIDAGMWGRYDVIDMTLDNNRLIINVAEGEY